MFLLSQGMVTMFNLDPDTTNDHLVWLFSKFGDVKVRVFFMLTSLAVG